MYRRITIQQPSYTVNVIGERVEAWSDWAKRWASIVPLVGRELEVARQLSPTVDVKITMRWMRAILPTYRVSWNGLVYAINSVINKDGEYREIDLYCTRKITG